MSQYGEHVWESLEQLRKEKVEGERAVFRLAYL